MRRKGLWLSVLATAMIAGNASAGTLVSGINVDGRVGTDWGVAAPTGQNGNNWTPTNQGGINLGPGGNAIGSGWVFEDSVGGSGYVGPQYGGQNFDVEALYTGYDITTQSIYVLLITGFDIGGEQSNPTYTPGDVFIDFGRYAPDWDNAHNVVPASAWDVAFSLAGATGAETQLNAISPITSIDYTPYLVAGSNSGPFRAHGTVDSNAVEFGYSNNGALDGWNASYDHNVYEFSYQVSATQYAQMLDNGLGGSNFGWTVNWTMSCGNDFLTAAGFVDQGTPYDPPMVPVPAAAPMGLLGMGLLALVRRVRRRPEC